MINAPFLVSILSKAWRGLTEPADSIQGNEQRRQARLLSSLLVFLIPFGCLASTIIPLFFDPGFSPFTDQPAQIGIFSVIVLAGAYGLSRTHRHIGAAVLTITILTLTLWLVSLPDSRGISDFGPLYSLSLIALLSSLLLPTRYTLILILINLAGIFLYPRIVPTVVYPPLGNPLSHLIAASFIIAIATTIRRRDLSKIEEHSSKLLQSEQRYRLIIETARDAIITIDAQGLVTGWNPRAEEFFGWSSSEMLGQRLVDRIVPLSYRKTYIRGIQHFLATGEGPVLNKMIEMPALHRDGHEFPVELSIWPMKVGETYTFSAFVRDITERKRAEQALRQDALTGLFNRRYMEEALEREEQRIARSHEPLAIIMIDLDHFKKFNDTYGHEAGNVLLREFGTLLRTQTREADIACRYGGEEFVLILPGASLEIARQRAELLCKAIKDMKVTYNNQLLGLVTLSAGVAVQPGDDSSGEMTLNAADAALYQAKHAGRDRVVIAEQMPIRPALENHRDGNAKPKFSMNKKK